MVIIRNYISLLNLYQGMTTTTKHILCRSPQNPPATKKCHRLANQRQSRHLTGAYGSFSPQNCGMFLMRWDSYFERKSSRKVHMDLKSVLVLQVL